MDVVAAVTHIPTISSAVKVPFNVSVAPFAFQQVVMFVIFPESLTLKMIIRRASAHTAEEKHLQALKVPRIFCLYVSISL